MWGLKDVVMPFRPQDEASCHTLAWALQIKSLQTKGCQAALKSPQPNIGPGSVLVVLVGYEWDEGLVGCSSSDRIVGGRHGWLGDGRRGLLTGVVILK